MVWYWYGIYNRRSDKNLGIEFNRLIYMSIQGLKGRGRKK